MDLTVHPDQPWWTDMQLQMLRDLNINPPQHVLAQLLDLCKRSGLSPFRSNQVYCISRGGKWTIQMAIDGFRIIAGRTGLLDGSPEPEYKFDKDGKVWAVTVNVYRKDASRPFGDTLFMSDYNKGQGMWKNIPNKMLSKCAEAAAYRKAFPAELAGFYEESEIQIASHAQPAPEQKFNVKPDTSMSQEDRLGLISSIDDLFKSLADDYNVDTTAMQEKMKTTYGDKPLDELSDKALTTLHGQVKEFYLHKQAEAIKAAEEKAWEPKEDTTEKEEEPW